MLGKASIEIPGHGTIGPMQYTGLSEPLALGIGRLFARQLSDKGVPVTVTLESGDTVVFLYETHGDVVVTGPVKYDMEVIRRCGGFREYARDIVMGPLL